MTGRRRAAFVMAAVALGAVPAFVLSAAVYLFGVKHYHYITVRPIFHFQFVRAYLFDPKFRRLVELMDEQDAQYDDAFASVWDTSEGTLLSRKMFRPVEMHGAQKDMYNPNLVKLTFKLEVDGFGRWFSIVDSPALRRATAEFGATHVREPLGRPRVVIVMHFPNDVDVDSNKVIDATIRRSRLRGGTTRTFCVISAKRKVSGSWICWTGSAATTAARSISKATRTGPRADTRPSRRSFTSRRRIGWLLRLRKASHDEIVRRPDELFELASLDDVYCPRLHPHGASQVRCRDHAVAFDELRERIWCALERHRVRRVEADDGEHLAADAERQIGAPFHVLGRSRQRTADLADILNHAASPSCPARFRPRPMLEYC